MNFRRLVLLSVMATSLGGCAYMNTTYRSLKPSDGAQLFVWHPDYSAGVGRQNSMCVQGARTATASSFNAAAELAAKARGGLGYGEAVRALNPSNPQVTFANNAYFAICQLAINGMIDSAQVADLLKHVTDKSLEIDNEAHENSAMNSPAVVDAIIRVLDQNNVEITPELTNEITEAVVEGENNSAENDEEQASVAD